MPTPAGPSPAAAAAKGGLRPGASFLPLGLGCGLMTAVWGLAPAGLLPLPAAAALAAAAALLVLAGLRVEPRAVAFLHPVGADGGGGERVLWCAVRAVQEADPAARVVLYTDADAAGRAPSDAALAARARARFGVELPRPVAAVPLRHGWLAQPATWPRLTLVGMAVGAALLGLEALWRLQPEVLVDTAGLTFALPLARLLGSRTAAYVHYPIVSTDMLRRVRDGVAMYNNPGSVAGSRWRTAAKVLYYRAFAVAYGLAGACVGVAMVNSSWTLGHVSELWFGWGRGGGARAPARVFPPCNTASLGAYPLRYAGPGVERTLISVAQFRPEKDHRLQLDAFARACAAAPAAMAGVRLVLVGGCRGEGDAGRVAELRRHAAAAGLGDRVEFRVNAPYAELQDLLGGAHAGLHTMLDEHFGIVVVEYMAAGAPPIAHASGGPAADIVRPEAGRLARTVEEYADAIVATMAMGEAEWTQMARAGRERSRLFGDEVFAAGWKEAMRGLLGGEGEAGAAAVGGGRGEKED